MRFENKYDCMLEEVSVANGAYWNDDSKIRLFARFMQETHVPFLEWEKFLKRQVTEESDNP